MAVKERLIPLSLSTAIVLNEILAPFQHDAVEPQPHIDSENNFPGCKRAIAGITSGGTSDTAELPGHFRRRVLYAKSLRVKKTRNRIEKQQILDALIDTANELANAYRQSLMRRFDSITAELPSRMTLGEPRCVVIAGNSAELSGQHMKENFELQRERMQGVTIITYDELFLRLERLVTLLEAPF